MRDKPDIEITRQLMLSLGFADLDVVSHPEAFGSWYIAATLRGERVRIVWDGRDFCLVIQRPSPGLNPDDWADHWIAGDSYSKTIGDLRDGLIEVMRPDQ